MHTRAALAIALLASLSGCPDPCEKVACDIRDEDCRERTWRALECDHGDASGDPPPTRVITEDEFRAEVIASYEEHEPEPDDVHWANALWLLGFYDEPGVDMRVSDRIGSVGAYYTIATQQITVVDRGEAMDLEADVALLAHELTHAMQDRALDLTAHYDAAEKYDDYLARSAVVEGDASMMQLLFDAHFAAVPREEIDWDYVANGWLEDRLEGGRGPLSVRAFGELLRYPLGFRHVAWAWQIEQRPIDDVLRAPPASTLALLADPFSDGTVAVREAIDCTSTEPPTGWRALAPSELGAMMTLAVLSAQGASPETALALAARVQGDVVLIAAQDDRTTVRWQIRVASTDAATEVANWLTGVTGNASVRTVDRDVIVEAAEEPPAELWADSPLCR